MKLLITSGGTKVNIDTVRHIGNMSSGTFGAKIALEALKDGHEVTFLKASGSKSPIYPDFSTENYMTLDYFDEVNNEYRKYINLFKDKCRIIEYSDFYEYQESVDDLLEDHTFDVIVLAAAVSDYGVENPVDGKIRSTEEEMTIKLNKLPKIISTVREKAPNSIIIGFKLLVNSTDTELINSAKKSLIDNNLDMVVANDLRDIKDNNHVIHLITKSGYDSAEADDDCKDRNYLANHLVAYFKYLSDRKLVENK